MLNFHTQHLDVLSPQRWTMAVLLVERYARQQQQFFRTNLDTLIHNKCYFSPPVSNTFQGMQPAAQHPVAHRNRTGPTREIKLQPRTLCYRKCCRNVGTAAVVLLAAIPLTTSPIIKFKPTKIRFRRQGYFHLVTNISLNGKGIIPRAQPACCFRGTQVCGRETNIFHTRAVAVDTG
jgi:hypothetical protein